MGLNSNLETVTKNLVESRRRFAEIYKSHVVRFLGNLSRYLQFHMDVLNNDLEHELRILEDDLEVFGQEEPLAHFLEANSVVEEVQKSCEAILDQLSVLKNAVDQKKWNME